MVRMSPMVFLQTGNFWGKDFFSDEPTQLVGSARAIAYRSPKTPYWEIPGMFADSSRKPKSARQPQPQTQARLAQKFHGRFKGDSGGALQINTRGPVISVPVFMVFYKEA